jgi:alpha-tubulin suppressor-like RCC1 family protein
MDELSGAVKFVDIQPIGHNNYQYFSMVALTEDGRVMTTGAPYYGQLGNGTNNAQGPWHRYYKLINFQ